MNPSTSSSLPPPTLSTVRTRGLGHRIERILLVVGIAVVIWLLYRIGAAAVWDNVTMVGWGFVLILGQEAITFLFNTKGWQWAFPRSRAPAALFRRLLAARMAGDAINAVTPTATVGGEVIRARMLRHHLDPTSVWASVAIAKLTQAFSQMVLLLVGLTLVLENVQLPDRLRQGMLVFLILIGAGLVTGIILQWRGRFASVLGVVERLGFALPAGLSAQLDRLDADIARFYAAPGPFVLSAGYFFAGWLMSIVEIYLIMLFLGMGGDWHRALTIEVLSLSIETVLFFVPGQAGTQEGGKVLIFTMLGLPPAKGLALGIVRRIRQLAWAVIGLVVLSIHQTREGGLRRRAPSEDRCVPERAA